MRATIRIIPALLLALAALALLPLTPTHAQRDDGRILAIDVSEAQGETYDDAFFIACATGAMSVGISLDWQSIETAPGEFDGSLFEIINIYYPAFGMPVDLTLRPLHTGTLQVPPDLADRPLDDPETIQRFHDLLDFVFALTPDVTWNSIVIGSEFDVYLEGDADLWAQYTNLAVAARDHIKAYDDDIDVAFEMIYAGLMGADAAYAAALNEHADVIGVSYYPLGDDFIARDPAVIHDDFAALVEAYPDTPIYFYQFGYPSSEVNGSSEAQQAQFIREAFAAWDDHADHIVMLDFTWLTDMSDESVAYFEDYYSFSSPGFAAFLGALGLRYNDGTAKAALAALQDEAAARDFASTCP